MKGGDLVLTPLPQADGVNKYRPVLILCVMRPFGDLLVCGVSTQLHTEVPGFDDIVAHGTDEFVSSGLMAPSLIRLGFLATVPSTMIKGRIGSIGTERYRRLMRRLADHFNETAARH